MGIIKMINLHKSTNRQLVLFMAAIMAFSMVAEAKTSWENGYVKFKLAHISPNGDEELRLEFTTRNTRLSAGETSTIICFRTEDDNYTIEEGAAAFGFQLWCDDRTVGYCEEVSQFDPIMIPSSAKSVSPLTWGTPAHNKMICASKGENSGQEGWWTNHFNFMSTAQFESSNLPGKDEEVFLQCFQDHLGTYNETNLNADLVLEGSQWYPTTGYLNVPEQKCPRDGSV